VLMLYIALSLLSVLPAWAADVLIVQANHGQALTEAVRGFKEAYAGSSRAIVLSDYTEVDVVRLVKEERPRLVLAVGDAALAASRKVRQVPVVSLLALATLQKGPTGTVSGVNVVPAPERYLQLLKGLGAKRVGVIYDPSRTGWYQKRAQQAAHQLGLELVCREVHGPRETLARLEQFKGTVDALWLFPDTTAVTAETVEAYFLFSLGQRIPVVAFANHYLEKGAVAALDTDRVDMGRQAGELASRLLSGTTPTDGGVVDARKAVLRTNDSVARKLGIALTGLEGIMHDKGE
jgi:putative tryptophan/tyrosine transport system substrate-binding protein